MHGLSNSIAEEEAIHGNIPPPRVKISPHNRRGRFIIGRAGDKLSRRIPLLRLAMRGESSMQGDDFLTPTGGSASYAMPMTGTKL
jgi:hypothetical protein